MAVKAVIFDMDDTLVDWSGFVAESRPEVLRNRLSKLYDHLVSTGHILPELNEFGALYHTTLNGIWDTLDEMSDTLPTYVEMLRDTLHKMEVDTSRYDLADLRKLIAGVFYPGVIAYPDARMVLESIRSSGLLTGLLTNAPYPIDLRHTELEGVGLLDLFDVKVSAEDVRYKKPNPRAFLAVTERLNVKPEEAVYVGDLLRDDVMGSQSAGLKAVWIRRRDDKPDGRTQPDATINALSELLNVLEGWR